MTVFSRKFLLSVKVLLLVSLFSVVGSAQCNFSKGQEGEICSTARYICGSELDGYTSTLREVNLTENIWPGSNSGVCRNAGTFDNTSWFSFTACATTVHLRITFSNCVHPTNYLPETGMQSGLFTECNRNSSVACDQLDNSTSGVLELQYNNFVPGELVYFVLDGYARSVCDFTIDVISGLDTTPVAPPDPTTLADGYITGKNIILCEEQDVPFTYTLLEPERKVNLSNACAPPNNFNPADSVCYAWNVVPSNGRYFANQDSTGKTVDIVFTEPGVYTIYADTYFNPYYVGSCANVAAGKIISWTVTVYPEVYVTDPISYICSGDSATFCGQTITRDTTIICDEDPCRIVTKEFKIIQPQINALGTQYICNGSGFIFQGVNYAQSGYYEVIDIADCGIKHSFSVEMIALSAQINTNNNTLDCNHPSVILNGSVIINGGLNATYEWRDASGNFISDQSLVNVSRSGEYSLTVTYTTPNGSCNDMEKILVLENFDKPSIAASVPVVRCLRLNDVKPSIRLTSNNTNNQFRWTKPNGQVVNSINIEVDSANTILGRPYLLKVVGPNGCTLDTSFTVESNFQKAKILLNGDDLTCYKPIQTLTVITDIAIDSIRWAKVGPDLAFYGSHLSKLSHDVITPGDYKVEVMASSSKCWNDESISIAENKVTPDFKLSEEIKWHCNTETIELIPEASLGDKISYSWNTKDGNIISNTSVKDITVGAIGNYEIFVFDTVNGCHRSGIVKIVEETDVPKEIIVNATNISCNGQNDGEIQIINTIGGFEPYHYFMNGSALSETQLRNLAPGSYSITVNDLYECLQEVNVVVMEPEALTVQTLPSITIDFTESLMLNFNSNYDDDEIVSVVWTNRNGDILGTDFNLNYTGEIDDELTVEVTTEQGCVNRSKIIVDVDNELKIFVPNIFSPNGDGVNDILEIFKNKIPSSLAEIAIYDRYGNKVLYENKFDFENNSLTWDGNFKGQALVPGVYILLIQLNDFLGKNHVFKKDITIIR